MLERIQDRKISMFVPNLKTHHREWHGPNFVEISGGEYHQVTIEGVGETRFFCVVDNNKLMHAYVIPDREVWVKYENQKSRAMVPAFLLCRTVADEWTMMLDKNRGWLELIDREDTEKDDEDETVLTGDSA